MVKVGLCQLDQEGGTYSISLYQVEGQPLLLTYDIPPASQLLRLARGELVEYLESDQLIIELPIELYQAMIKLLSH